MPARRGSFGASLRPFGGGMLNLDDAYRVEALTPSGGPPPAAAPPPLYYGGSGGTPWDQEIPIVGATPVPDTAASAPPAAWSPTPVSATVAGTLAHYIRDLSAVAAPTPAQSTTLATYQARQEEYLARGTPTGVDYSPQIAALDKYIANLTASGTDPAKLALYEARRVEYAAR